MSVILSTGERGGGSLYDVTSCPAAVSHILLGGEGFSVPGPMFLLSMAGVSIWGISVWGVSFWGSLSGGGISIQGDLSPGGSLSREAMGLCVGISVGGGRTPRIRNALFFLLQSNNFIPGSLRLPVLHFIPHTSLLNSWNSVVLNRVKLISSNSSNLTNVKQNISRKNKNELSKISKRENSIDFSIQLMLGFLDKPTHCSIQPFTHFS